MRLLRAQRRHRCKEGDDDQTSDSQQRPLRQCDHGQSAAHRRRFYDARRSVGSMQRLEIYTDGACQGNPGPGGWGWAVSPEGEPCGSGGEPDTTNQRMEIFAALDALRTYSTVADDALPPLNK